jgi:hypothetical protein
VSVSAIVVSPSGILVGDAALDEASISGYAVAFSRASSILIDPKVSGCSRARSTSPCGSGSSNRRVLLLAGAAQASKTRTTPLMSMPVFRQMTVRDACDPFGIARLHGRERRFSQAPT